MIVLSNDSASSASTANWSRCNSLIMRAKTPDLAQQLSRMYIVCHGPNSAGSARQVQPSLAM